MRAAALAWLASACGAAPVAADATVIDAFVPDETCRLENVIARDVAGEPLTDCGHLAIDADPTAARDCALSDAASHTPFILLWDAPGIDSRIAHAYVGLDSTSGWSLVSYAYDGDPGGGGGENHPSTVSWTCASLDDLGDCGADRATTLCLACGAPATESGMCRSP